MVMSTSNICMLILEQLKYSILSSEKRSRKEGEIQSLHTLNVCPNLKDANAVSFEWMKKESGGMALSSPFIQDNSSTLNSSAQIFLLTAPAWHLCVRGLFLREQIWKAHLLWDHLSASLKSGKHHCHRGVLSALFLISQPPHPPLFFFLASWNQSIYRKACSFSSSLKEGERKNV